VFSSSARRLEREPGCGVNSGEKWVGSILAGLVLVSFFFPLSYSTVPIAGTTSASGYDIVTLSDDEIPLQRALESIEGNSTLSPTPASRDVDLPGSLRFAHLLKAWIVALFAGAAVAAGAALLASRAAFLWSSGLATIAGILAIVHIRIMNSDVHEFMSHQFAQISEGLEDNPFAGFAQGLGQMLMGSIEIGPGPGLYFATGLMLVLFLSIGTGLLSRIRINVAPSREHDGRDPDWPGDHRN
jgi:hypothetical protein